MNKRIGKILKRQNEYWNTEDINIDLANVLVNEIPYLVKEIENCHKELVNQEKSSDREIERLRRVLHELEEERKTHAPHGRNYTDKQYMDLLKENKRLQEVKRHCREALEFYADVRNYKERDFGVIVQPAIQDGDIGSTARKALEESE